MKITNILIPAGVGLAVYEFFPQVKKIFVGSGSSGTTGFISSSGTDGATTKGGTILKNNSLTKKQLGFISSQLDNSSQTIINTSDNGQSTKTTITTDVKNRNKIESSNGLKNLINLKGSVIYKKNNKIVSGTDFTGRQSLTKTGATRLYNTRKSNIGFIEKQREPKVYHTKKYNFIPEINSTKYNFGGF